MLIASLFFLNNFTFASSSEVLDFYKEGFEYSQKGQNNKAFDLMMKSADLGYAPAQNNIGLSYLHGLGVEKNDTKAYEYLSMAAFQGLNHAQTELGMLFYQGRGVKKNIDKARKWWTISSQGKDEYAQYNLASLLLELGDQEKAIYWLKEAYKNKHPLAEDALIKLGEFK